MKNYRLRLLYEALTRYNYFPNQKSNINELPPCLSTRQFTPEIAEQLAALRENDNRKSNGYDVVIYNATRYNNAFRELSLVHPKAHALLSKHIHDNWDEIAYIEENDNSIIKPDRHQDGRLMVMNYEDPIEKTTRTLTSSFGKRFQVHADVSNCFNSIYSHAIAWGLVGFEHAKANRGRGEWFNKLDEYQRKCKRNETQGIPIGPATSSVSVEIVLGKVDEKLRDEGFQFHRYVDDYSCYCETNEDAHRFIRILGNTLSRYKLTLNIQKTEIIEHPVPDQDSWVLNLLGALPSRLHKAHPDEPKLTDAEAITFINHALVINKKTPDGSVLKYAIQLIINFLDSNYHTAVYRSVLNLSWHFPILIPYLEMLLEHANLHNDELTEHLNKLVLENCNYRRSDGICWPLYIMKKKGILVQEDTIKAVVESEDCVGLTILSSMLLIKDPIVEFAQKIIDSNDNYTKDSYWLLLYQLFRSRDVVNAYQNRMFEILLENDVNFLPEDGVETDAEKESARQRGVAMFGPVPFSNALQKLIAPSV
ncbi:RNA-directed DNA polymerase [Vibrio europaeus]|uniref:antiviral reverse transcriptase Drt4 n=1 Tax=Vibrio europaeus TaxID=300876 RepID=UPI00233F4B5B|nr:antiviral reverse transcriptase Drt4 [Vibrio europaeus]MDC5806385.1 RNA-directed DNA polymerase [Vibrio europaeus]MDC5807790.1 RNA-directed DNA polymerase [Vibrio europaeus]MDC5807994.1 RNA-directed DNA polymerase [Vibrio europaeus]MDC5830820.1 RNA-directed DNA polymerase [Vibrio europaeus]MDC5830906.1 RNA-directed DNA polymerase [Vibrio europaeus]